MDTECLAKENHLLRRGCWDAPREIVLPTEAHDKGQLAFPFGEHRKTIAIVPDGKTRSTEKNPEVWSTCENKKFPGPIKSKSRLHILTLWSAAWTRFRPRQAPYLWWWGGQYMSISKEMSWEKCLRFAEKSPGKSKKYLENPLIDIFIFKVKKKNWFKS